MLNSKGLVVSSVLYTLLIAFLLFLGITLANFSASTKIVSSTTKDLVDGEGLQAKQVYEVYDKDENFEGYTKPGGIKRTDFGSGPKCGTDYQWYEKLEKNEVGQVKSRSTLVSNTIVRIYSRYGTTYWPRDFDGFYSKTNKLIIKRCIQYWPDGSHTYVSECDAGIKNDGTLWSGGIISKLKNNQITHVKMYLYDSVLDPTGSNLQEVIISNICP